MDPDTKNQDGTKRVPFEDLSKEELISKCKGLLIIAQKAKQAKSELQQETETYKSQIQKIETEKNFCLQNNKTLQELVDSLTEQKLNYITEIDAAQAKVRSLNEICHKYEEEVNTLRADLIVRDQNIGDISQKLSDFDSEIISLKRQNNRLLEENEQLITQLSEMEARVAEFNTIGLQQREQLKILEEKFHNDDASHSQIAIEGLNEKIRLLESSLETKDQSYEEKLGVLDRTVKELTNLYESEKVKTDKANIKLRSYKEKILKCATCINQLKNSRFILSKTVKEYSENVPKWQNEIIKASKVLEKEINELNAENISLREKNQELESKLKEVLIIKNEGSKEMELQLNVLHEENNTLKSNLYEWQQQVNGLKESNLIILDEKELLQRQINDLTLKLDTIVYENSGLVKTANELNLKNKYINELLHLNDQNSNVIDTLNLQIKALESEKAILVKEKLNARDTVLELENQNKSLLTQFDALKLELETKKSQLDTMSQEILKLKESNETEVKILKTKVITLQESNDKLKKEYENMLDLNGLLRDEVETLKLSLEQPKDDNENLSDLNVSLQADIVKLETKLSAYKQENASLLAEIKETRGKVKEYDNIVAEFENAKSKLLSYKTENTELLNEMKEINQVLKERGESISKLQKAVSEMERLIETLEKDRDVIKQERDDLLTKVRTLKCDLESVKEMTSQNCEGMEKIVLERDNALRMLSEKENAITNLKEDIEKLRQQISPASEFPNEDMSTSTVSKAEEHSRMKDLDETFEDKYTKLRIFALKLKKKLNEVTSQLQTSEQEKSRLKKILDDNEVGFRKNDVNSATSGDDNTGFNKNEKPECEYEISELKERIKSLSNALEASEKSLSKLESLEGELATKSQQLLAEKEAHQTTKKQLDKALKDVKKKNVLSLEMEDYERSMKELTAKMEENKKKIIQMESTIDTQEGTINAMKTQIKLLEEQIKMEETQNRLLKQELHNAVEEGKEKDSIINSKKDIISKLMIDLEDEKRKNEECDLEMTALLSEKEKIIMSIGEENAELHNKIKRLEFKCGDLNEKLRITNIELADLKTEYTSYKVRAQAVLRQNQTVDHSQEEQLKEEAAALKSQIENLEAKYATLQEQYTERSLETEAARKRANEASNEAARAHQRNTRLQTDLARLAHTLESERSQHKLQVSTLTQCYKAQINDLENKLQKETEALRAQLAVAQENINSGKNSQNPDKQFMLPVIPKDENSDGEMDINVSLIPREEGEGSESAPSPPHSKPYLTNASGRRSPMPLERLLEEGVPDDDTLDSSSLVLTPEQEILDLRRKLQGQQQRVKHVTVLLAESERECARMAQLSELLKSELRRVRGSSTGAHNTEYMKNVTFKFLTLPPGDERSRLIPVLQKILTLSPEETQKIQALARGQDPNANKGWGSYLPWPGSK